MKRILFTLIFCFTFLNLSAQTDTIKYYFNKEDYITSAIDMLPNGIRNIYINNSKKLKIYSIPIYIFNDSIKVYNCGDNLEILIDFTQVAEFQTLFITKNNKIKYSYTNFEYWDNKQGKSMFDIDYLVSPTGYEGFLPSMRLRSTKENNKSKLKEFWKQNKPRRHFNYRKLFRYISKHPDVHVFQLTYVPGFWAVRDGHLIKLSKDNKVKISDANKLFCKTYPPCDVRYIYGEDKKIKDLQECGCIENSRRFLRAPKCNNCEEVMFKNIVLINTY